ncbi:MAG TPA: hemolysin family protein [Flavobacteriales bacterium]|nr:hemolysin family protein [Flavobacteriales bacterium]
MDSATTFAIISAVIFSAFFSGIEIAFVSANRLKIELDNKQGSLSARILSFFIRREDKFITTVLIGNNIALVTFGIFFAALIEPSIIKYITHNHILILLIQSLISTIFIVVIAEYFPKILFSINPNSVLKALAVPMAVIYGILWLPTMITTIISRLVLVVFMRTKKNNDKNEFDRTDLDDYIKQATEIAAPDQVIDHEVQIFKNALEFSKVRGRDCMVPRTEIIAVEIDENINTLKQKFIETHLSKILIYRESIDDIIGYVHSFEMFKQPSDIKSILRPISFVPESMPGHIIMQEFTRQRRSIAVVVDEFGGTAGILTIEDLLEEIIGEIDDEHDTVELIENKISDTEYIFSGRLEIDYLNQKYYFDLPTHEDYDTLAGYILKLYQDIPVTDTVIETGRFSFTVLEAIDTKIEKIKVEIK